jgi:hypothetical protein
VMLIEEVSWLASACARRQSACRRIRANYAQLHMWGDEYPALQREFPQGLRS